MNGKQTMYRDQWGNTYWAKTVKALRRQIGMGGSAVRKMYCDKKDGSIVHTGYVIGGHWLEAYRRVELPA